MLFKETPLLEKAWGLFPNENVHSGGCWFTTGVAMSTEHLQMSPHKLGHTLTRNAIRLARVDPLWQGQ